MNRSKPLRIVVAGLSITSSWGNGHATTYRGLIRELSKLGHDVLFLERDVPWYSSQRDLTACDYCEIQLYDSVGQLRQRFESQVRQADLVIAGSYVPDGVQVGEWIIRTAKGLTAFYDIDTPVTLAKLAKRDHEYIEPSLISAYHLYLSFTGGPILKKFTSEYGARHVRPLYCSADPGLYYPETAEWIYDLGYLGTYSPDRQPPLERLMLEPARQWPRGKFVVAGPQYPKTIEWPANVERFEHLPPPLHRSFYNSQRFSLNVTRADMIQAGYSPSVRLFEAAACGVPIISDPWEGLEQFFVPGQEILLANSAAQCLEYLTGLEESERRNLAERARQKVLEKHTAGHRAQELIDYYHELASNH